MNTKYREKILKQVRKYYDELDSLEFSHNSDHFYRVENIAKKIAVDENADIEIIEAAALIFDVARNMEDKGEVEDHSEKAVEIAKEILIKIGFPNNKIEAVCHAILVHRRSKNREPQTIEAKILRDADYLDAMGAIDVARVFSSCMQSNKYKKAVYVDKPLCDVEGLENISGIHFMYYKLIHPKHLPDNFLTKTGRYMAKERYNFMKDYVERFVKEWHGEM